MAELNKNLIRVGALADVAKHVGGSNEALKRELQAKGGSADTARKFWSRANSLLELVDVEHEDADERRIAKTWLMKMASQLQIEGQVIKQEMERLQGRIAQTEATAQWIRKRAEAEAAAAERTPIAEAIDKARKTARKTAPKKAAKKKAPASRRRKPAKKKANGKN